MYNFIKNRLRLLDKQFLVPILILVSMGLLTIYSAGRNTNQSYLWIKQLIWNLLGFILIMIMSNSNPIRFFRASFTMYVIGILSLIAVLIVGQKIGGAQRWINVGQQLKWQPSELMKWLTLLVIAHNFGSTIPNRLSNLDIIKMFILIVIPILLILKQPDLGMAISFLPILLIIPISKGLKLRWVIICTIITLILSLFIWNNVMKPYQKQRIITFLDPRADPYGKGYQINQSRIAIGSGGLFGQGFTNGSQTQLNFLPVKTTDFIFSAWAEERGFVGVIIAISLFGIMLNKILHIAKITKQYSEIYFCIGAAGIMAIHIFVSIGMVIGLLPNKGIVLPFFSAGGSSTISYSIGIGLINVIYYRSKIK